MASTPQAQLQALAGLVVTGESETAQRVLGQVDDARLPEQARFELALLAQRLGLHEQALALCVRHREMGAQGPSIDYLQATLSIFCGEIDSAEPLLERCIARAPDYSGAHWTLAHLRRWSSDRNHLQRLQRALASGHARNDGESYLWFALFKECDDLGDPQAWPALVRGCLAKRRQLSYDATAEAGMVAWLAEQFALPPQAAGDTPAPGPTPIFVVGMPRSGTTLLERLLGRHPEVMACGELPDFPQQLGWAGDRVVAQAPDPTTLRRARDAGAGLVGARYLEQTRWRSQGRAWYTDKLPRNFWNIGFIAQALPQSPILHMRRDPMDTCFSNLKELFGAAYPYSYNLAELASHYANYRQLMDAWHRAMPGRILDVHYEALVQDPEREMRRVLAHCGLRWDPACASTEGGPGAVATASTVQVRAPVHRNSIGGWRRYAGQLDPLLQMLERPVAPAHPG